MPFDSVKHDETTKNLSDLCDVLAKTSTFDIKTFAHACGTPACIAGHASWLWPDVVGEYTTYGRYRPNFDKFAAKIGVSEEKLYALCMLWEVRNAPASNSMADPELINNRMAIAALKRLKATGEHYYDYEDR